jgi:DNA-binding XRE family transcriptional regulator
MKAARVNVNKTVKEAAKEIGVTERTISKWESGTIPSSRYIMPILKCYNCTFDDIRFSK